MAEKRQLVIIGGGPGGYLAALRAAQLGLKATLVEDDRVGGTCINYGCIPTKYLLHRTKSLHELKTARDLTGPAAQVGLDWGKVQTGRKAVVDRLVSGLNFLLEKGKAELIKGRASLSPSRAVSVQCDGGPRVLEADKVIVATGSVAAGLPFISFDGSRVISSTEALELAEVPRSLLVVGAGAIGLELGSVYQRAGSDVTILEIMPSILPGSDLEACSRLERVLKRQGLKIFTNMRIDRAEVDEGGVTLSGACTATGAAFSFTAEKVLLAAGRRPNTTGLFAAEPCLELARGGFIKVNEQLETSLPGVYAIGDVIGGKLLAHKAYYDGVLAAENAAGRGKRAADYRAVPSAVFTDPEFASVGMTQEEAVKEHGTKVKAGVFPLQASGRALTLGAAEGMVKIIADEAERVLGAHIVAPGASEMLPVLTMAVARGLKLDEVASVVYVHPSLGEAIGEAALKARKEALHILND